jgi:YebC/PmpR family DNA-binding regulatory protein
MAGHSKWKQIKRKKAVTDARRASSWTKVIREITVAAKSGGGDPNGNPRLRTAIDAAKAVNMPNDNIDRAIKKGTGELEGSVYEELTYEGYGPGGAAIFIEATTDNPNRTVAEIRHAFSRNAGNLGATNSVAWMFDRKGQIYLDAGRYDEDSALEAALEAGAEDFAREGDQYIVTTAPAAFHGVQDALKARQFAIDSAELTMVPRNTVKVEGADAERILKLMEALEELDDVSRVSSNFDIDAAQLAEGED